MVGRADGVAGGGMITAIEDYFAKGCGRCDRFATPDCATRLWADALAALRRLCLEQGLAETVKWAHPCYMHAGRNVVLIGALRDGVRLSFFDAALMTDPARLLEKQGPNTRHPDVVRFASAAEVAAREPALRAYLAEAKGYAEAGVRPARATPDVDLPPELTAALAADPVLADAFARLTPGRRRSYVIRLSSAKTEATRAARVAGFRDGILAGKGAMER